jgi:hypothetical protein
VIANQQAEISNKIKFGSDYHVASEDIETNAMLSSIETAVMRDS